MVHVSLDAIRALLPRLADGAAARDAERSLPSAEIDEVSATGALAVTVPAEHGGPGGGAVAAAEVTRLLATADPSIAQIPQSHFVYLRFVQLAGGERLRKTIFSDVIAGQRIANAQSERGGRTITDIATRITFDGDEAVVDGRKFYATGSLFAHWFAVLARDDDGVDHIAYVPKETAGVEVVDDWNGFGQRTTGSGTVTFSHVRVPRDLTAPRSEAITGPHAYGAFAQLLHAAIDTGLARGALGAAAEVVRTTARPWFEAVGDWDISTAAQDPLTIQRFGELEVTTRAAEAALAQAALTVDQNPADASLAVAAAKVLADRAANEVSAAIVEVGGASAADARRGLDRHWRDARTHTAHDPVRWKIQHLGRWAIDGTAPPRHGLI